MNMAMFGMQVGALAAKLEYAEQRNAEKDELGVKLVRQQKLLQRAETFKNAYDYGLKKIAIVSSKYKKQRTDMLEHEVENALDLAFPDEHFRIHLESDTRGKDETVTLLIGRLTPTGDIAWGTPYCRSGDFAKQLISLAVVSAINLMLGSQMLLADEPLSHGDPISIGEIQPFFDWLTEMGLQTLFIEHAEEMYKNIARREIILEKNRAAGVVNVVSNTREGEVFQNADTQERTESTPDGNGVFSASGSLLLDGGAGLSD